MKSLITILLITISMSATAQTKDYNRNLTELHISQPVSIQADDPSASIILIGTAATGIGVTTYGAYISAENGTYFDPKALYLLFGVMSAVGVAIEIGKQ